MDRVVLRYVDGRVVKGQPIDFTPVEGHFQVRRLGQTQACRVELRDLKAVFYVKFFDGRPFYRDRKEFRAGGNPGGARKVVVRFTDGEEMYGWTRMYSATGPGFFVYPTDSDSNNERVFVVNGPCIRDVEFPE
jgi:hypothetical protein